MYNFIIIILLINTATLFASEYRIPHRCDLSQSITTAPEKVQEKYARGIHPRCIFLTSVYEKDDDAVLWFFNNDKGYAETKKPSLQVIEKGTIISAYKDFSSILYYFSLCPQERNPHMFITPYDIAHYKNNDPENNNKMLVLLHCCLGEDPNKKMREENGDSTPYSLFMKACSKPENYSTKTETKIKTLPFETNSHFPARKKSQWSAMLFLIALLNNDEQLKNIVLKSEHFHGIDDALLRFIGRGFGKSLFTTDEEIISLFSHPWIIQHKPECIKSMDDIIEIYKDTSKKQFYIQTELGKKHFKRVLKLIKNIPTQKKDTVNNDDDAPLTLKEYLRGACFLTGFIVLYLGTKYYLRLLNPEIPILLLLFILLEGGRK